MNKEIGAKIRKLRELRQMSQGELAAKAGIAQSTLSYIENGKKYPQFHTLSAICRGLDISILELFSYEVLKANKKLFEKYTISGNSSVSAGISEQLLKALYHSEKHSYGIEEWAQGRSDAAR